MEVCGGCVAACLSIPRFGRKCVLTVTAFAFGWNGDGFTEQCPWQKEFVSCERVDKARRCDCGPHA